ncbi:MAG: hypothetical protein J2P49_08365, partial [Methylocapsa sp.]|nr:hypothetical protein [Methylocapsa sp.]
MISCPLKLDRKYKTPSRAARKGKALSAFCLLVLLPALAACNSVTGMFGPGAPAGGMPPGIHAESPAPPAMGERIGSGEAKVGLVLPLTQASGGPSSVGVSLRNAAELAYLNAGNNDITLFVKDDRSTPEGARAAVQSALAEGAELIIGPLFASNAREAAAVARSAGKP